MLVLISGTNTCTLSNAYSDADIVYFRIKSVYNDNLRKESQKCNSINKLLDTYYKTGDEKPIRSTHGVPWGKMIKRELIEKYDIRFEATMYTNDRFFSINSGIYATKICVANEMLYYYVDRPHSLTDNFNKKPNELRIRAEVNFQVEKYLLKHGMCVNRYFKFFMWAMLKQDHQLFRYYFNRLNEIYPSKLSALIDIAKGHNIIYQIIYYLYIPWILISIPFCRKHPVNHVLQIS